MITQKECILESEDTVLYRDDGLAAVEGNARHLDNLRKELHALFKKLGLKITWEVYSKKSCFLDILFDLETETFKPYCKQNFKVNYVCKGSNHPPNVIRNLPLNINRRLQNISSNEIGLILKRIYTRRPSMKLDIP